MLPRETKKKSSCSLNLTRTDRKSVQIETIDSGGYLPIAASDTSTAAFTSTGKFIEFAMKQ